MTNITNQPLPPNNIASDISYSSTQQLKHSNFDTMINLADLLTSDVPWQVHNCKLISVDCKQDETLPFLYHYDRLADNVKVAFPLDAHLLKVFNQPMTADQANKTIGLPAGSIQSPWFVKLKGSIVIYLESMQLAVKLHWSNTTQQAHPIYCEHKEKAIAIAVNHWQFVGNVHVLNKACKQIDKDVVVTHELANNSLINSHGQFIIKITDSYQALPSEFAVALITQLHEKKSTLTFIDTAIRTRVS